MQKIGPSQLTEGDHLKGALLRSGCLIDHLQDGTRSGVHEKDIINDTAKLRNGLLVISLSCTCSLTSSVRVSLSSIGFTLSIIRAP